MLSPLDFLLGVKPIGSIETPAPAAPSSVALVAPRPAEPVSVYHGITGSGGDPVELELEKIARFFMTGTRD